VRAARRLQQRLIKKLDQVVGVHVGPKNDVAPLPAVPTVRAASGHEFFAPKTDAPISAIPGFCMNSDPIDEHGF
jgi:hypothetical protein